MDKQSNGSRIWLVILKQLFNTKTTLNLNLEINLANS